MRFIALLFVAIVFSSLPARADGTHDDWTISKRNPTGKLPAQRIPGEEMEDMHGNTSKVWTTGGEVAGHDSHQDVHEHRRHDDIDVIVDGRDVLLDEKNGSKRDDQHREK